MGGAAGGVVGGVYGAATSAAEGWTHCGTDAAVGPQGAQAGQDASAPSPQGPTVMEARAQPPIKSVEPPEGSPPGTKSYEIGKNKITLTPQPAGTYKADFDIREDFGDVERSSATRTAGANARANGEDGDVGFHTVAHRFLPGLTETLVPGNGSLNLSSYKAMENRIAGQIRLGNTVSGSIQPVPREAIRPIRLIWPK